MALCACGCGAVTTIDPRTNQPNKYIQAHNGRINRRRYVMKRNGGNPKNEHTLVAEKALGKPLPKGAQVHHVDENKRNNANTNLVICQDLAYHRLLHVRARVVRRGGNPNTHKYCHRCDSIKPFAAFYFSKHRGGLISTCIACCAVIWAARKRPSVNWRDVAILGGDLGL